MAPSPSRYPSSTYEPPEEKYFSPDWRSNNYKEFSLPKSNKEGRGTFLANRIAAAAKQALRQVPARGEQRQALDLSKRASVSITNQLAPLDLSFQNSSSSRAPATLEEFFTLRLRGRGYRPEQSRERGFDIRASGRASRSNSSNGRQAKEEIPRAHQRGQLASRRSTSRSQAGPTRCPCPRCVARRNRTTSSAEESFQQAERNEYQRGQFPSVRQGYRQQAESRAEGGGRKWKNSALRLPPKVLPRLPVEPRRALRKNDLQLLLKVLAAAFFLWMVTKTIGMANGKDSPDHLRQNVYAGPRTKAEFIDGLPQLRHTQAWIENASWLKDDKGRDISKRNADRKVTAYDCSQPLKLEDMALDDGQYGCDENVVAVDTKNHTYQLLVKESKQRLTGKRCVMTTSRKVSYCGKYSHTTTFDEVEYSGTPGRVSAEACRMLSTKNQYIQPDGQVVHITEGEYYHGFYFEAGHSGWGPGNFPYTKERVQCEGEDWKHLGRTYSSVVVSHHYVLGFFPEEFLWDRESMVALTNNVRLPTIPRNHDIETGEATYIWDGGDDWCPMAVAKTVTGLIVEDERKRRVFMSTDGNLVRLIEEDQETICGRLIRGTNYPELYLADADSRRPFSRRVDTSSISMSTYVNERDDYLYNQMIDQINRELKNVLTKNCEDRRTKARQDYFMQHENPGIVTYGFGNGTFAATAGEVMYYYVCKPEVVTAKELDQCYDALPVALAYDSPLIKSFNASTQWFVEPLTRRLTRFASVVSCTVQFPAKFQTNNGNWLAVTPHIREAPRPRMTTSQQDAISRLTPEKDFSQGGVYDEEDMKAWEAYAFTGRIRDAVSSRLAVTVSQNYEQGSGSVHFQTPASWFHSHLMGLIDFLDRFGKAAAICISVTILWQVINKIVSALYGACQIYRANTGCTWRILWSLCPTMFLIRGRGRGAAEQGRGAEEEEVPPPRGLGFTRNRLRSSLQGLYRRVAREEDLEANHQDREEEERHRRRSSSRQSDGGRTSRARRESEEMEMREFQDQQRYSDSLPREDLRRRTVDTKRKSKSRSHLDEEESAKESGGGDRRDGAKYSRSRSLPPGSALPTAEEAAKSILRGMSYLPPVPKEYYEPQPASRPTRNSVKFNPSDYDPTAPRPTPASSGDDDTIRRRDRRV